MPAKCSTAGARRPTGYRASRSGTLRTRRCRRSSSLRVAGYRAGVRLEPLSVFRWSYEKDVRVKGGCTIVSAYESEEGIAYGEAHATTEPYAGGLGVPG